MSTNEKAVLAALDGAVALHPTSAPVLLRALHDRERAALPRAVAAAAAAGEHPLAHLPLQAEGQSQHEQRRQDGQGVVDLSQLAASDVLLLATLRGGSPLLDNLVASALRSAACGSRCEGKVFLQMKDVCCLVAGLVAASLLLCSKISANIDPFPPFLHHG